MMFETMPFFALLGAGMLLLAGCTGCQTDSAAPEQNWPRTAPEEQGFDAAALADVIEQIDAQDMPIDSLLVVRNGVLVLDAYFYPYREDLLHDVASVTKSVTSTLVGIATDRSLLSLDQKVLATFPELTPASISDGKEDIDLRDLLTMSSGLDCGRAPGEPELYEMIASSNWIEYALSIPMAVAPGTEFAYCSPGSHVLSAMITKATAKPALDFARDALFGPLGILHTEWPDDPQGFSHGWGDLRLHPRDMARIGHLFLNEGSWNGLQVVSEEWVDQATRHQVTADADGTGYGYQWWVLSGAFAGLYEARGRGGQAIIAWPDKDIVAVFTGRGMDVRAEVAPLLIAALKSDEPLPPNPEASARLAAAIAAATEPPAAQAVPPLPPTAGQVTGRVYRLGVNQLDLRCVALDFASPSDVSLRLAVGSASFAFPVGMDGVPRFSETGPTDMAVGITGAWVEPTVFLLHYDEVAGPNHFVIRAGFSGASETVSLQITDPGGYYPAQSVTGAEVPSCF
jgi:CubicO group peptidase (beta-lactamase class C family)